MQKLHKWSLVLVSNQTYDSWLIHYVFSYPQLNRLFCLFTVMPKGGNILFVRGKTQGGDREGARVANPDEIELDEEDEGSDESEKEEEGNYMLHKVQSFW